MVKRNKYNPDFDFEAVFEPRDYIYFYEDNLTKEKTDREVDFLVRELDLNQPMQILDLACGYGRHANRLATLGHSVTGVDISPGFLDTARKEAKKQNLNVQYIRGDMRNIAFKDKFDRVLLLFTSFGYFEDADNFKILKNAALALKPGGLFCLDTMNRDTFLKFFIPFSVVEKGRDLMINRNSFDPLKGRVFVKRTVIRNGERKEKPFFVRLYNLTEMRDLMERVNLTITGVFGDWDPQPLTDHSKRMILIVQKGVRPECR